MQFQDPYLLYSAASNLEAHSIVELLHVQGIDAYGLEDNSDLSLWAFGRISQFHLPSVWVDKSQAEAAARWIVEFEDRRRQRQQSDETAGAIDVVCEACGKTSVFPAALDGTTQNCSHCRGYVDVGIIPWSSEGHAC